MSHLQGLSRREIGKLQHRASDGNQIPFVHLEALTWRNLFPVKHRSIGTLQVLNEKFFADSKDLQLLSGDGAVLDLNVILRGSADKTGLTANTKNAALHISFHYDKLGHISLLDFSLSLQCRRIGACFQSIEGILVCKS